MVEKQTAVEDAGPIPEPYSIPPDVLQGWLSTDPDQYIAVLLRRADLDKLFNVMYHTLNATANSTDAFLRFSQGDLENANRRIDHFRLDTATAMNELKKLFHAIMVQSRQVPNGK